MMMLNGYKVVRFDYSAIEKIFSITAERKDLNKTIRIDIYNPTTDEITDAIDAYSRCSNIPLNLLLMCFNLE